MSCTREIDDDADIGHPRRERTDPGDGDRENVLILDRALDRLHRRIEALDMADHERHTGAPRRRDNGTPLVDGRGDRLLDHDVDAARGAGDGDIAVQMRRRRDRDGVDALVQECIGIVEGSAPKVAGDGLAPLAVGIGNADQLYPGQFGQDAGMVTTHYAYADNADAQRFRAKFRSVTHKPPRYPEPNPTVFP